MSAAKAVPVVGPVIERTETGLERAEDEMWRQVRHRMDTVAPSDGTVVVSVDHSPARRSNGTNALATVLTDLLVVSTEQSAEDARQRLYASVLNELQPDEARIFAALSDGTRYAVLHVVSRGHLGQSGPALLENASTVGRAAGVALPDMVPWYVGHLIRLGLAVVEPEVRALADTYDILETEPYVREAQAAAGNARLVRRSLLITPFGARLWDVCQTTAQLPQH
jgi:hypothetical protein